MKIMFYAILFLATTIFSCAFSSESLRKDGQITSQKKSLKQNKNDTFVIGPWRGGMGICLHTVLKHLSYCDHQNKIPVVYWGSKCAYFTPKGFNQKKNVWEYYFEQISNENYSSKDAIHVYDFQNPHVKFNYYNVSQPMREAAYDLISKYIRPNYIVQGKIDQFYYNKMSGKKTIGIHIRGTDKVKEEKPVDPERMVAEALKYADEKTQFFVATDEQKILDNVISLLQGRAVVYYECKRSNNGQALHSNKNSRDKAQNGEDVVVEMILLSLCDVLIHTLSNVSAVPLYFNPYMPHVCLK